MTRAWTLFDDTPLLPLARASSTEPTRHGCTGRPSQTRFATGHGYGSDHPSFASKATSPGIRPHRRWQRDLASRRAQRTGATWAAVDELQWPQTPWAERGARQTGIWCFFALTRLTGDAKQRLYACDYASGEGRKGQARGPPGARATDELTSIGKQVTLPFANERWHMSQALCMKCTMSCRQWRQVAGQLFVVGRC